MDSSLGNKRIMAKNIQHFMDLNGVTRRELADAIDTPYTTICGWLSAKAYPRIDKIEMMANYFGVQKKDLVEDADMISRLNSYYGLAHNDNKDKGRDLVRLSEEAELLNTLQDRPEMRMLFKSAKTATKEQIESVARMLDSFKTE